jgi:epoxyqueuosine reductase
LTVADSINHKRSQLIKSIGNRLGFDYVGISQAVQLDEEAINLEKWLNQNYHGSMSYMGNHFDKRIDPRKLVPGAKSVVSLLLNYYNPNTQIDSESPKLSMYAYGEDYHFVIKRKLKEFVEQIQTDIGEVGGRVFVDSAPVMDKAWAKKSGLGWVGKNSNIINKKSGSFFFIAELIIDLELEPDGPIKDYCGTCTKCIDACPTEAIIKPYVVDGSKCISYLTIELKTEIEASWKTHMDDWMFGCDICQTVCPWNRFSKQHSEDAFSPSEGLLTMKKEEWLELTEEVFQNLFSKSAVKRTGYNRLKQTIRLLKSEK